MSKDFEELDYRPTPLGDLTLRRRRMHSLGGLEIYEVKLGDAFLMSSLFHVVEEALSTLGLAALPPGEWDVVVGGLGLGYTAAAALDHAALRSLIIVDLMQGVIDWHRSGMVPLGPRLTGDPRCRIVQGDFFALAESRDGFDPDAPARLFDAVLLDIDHSPHGLLHPSHGGFYQPEGLSAFAAHLRPGGVFALWSDDAPDEDFMAALNDVFASLQAHTVTFENPLLEEDSSSTVYVARKAG